eukprot:Blabericola_migrator_1__2688@NODE_1762_length_3826_cov_71_386273_g738_i1_p1_GENE_NODE_1762_length_3826_cov_71_386273_g738_i1NODE_1762_length_3826_cov_71_386273_g738_i1_p1_ORF_typecomplete_len922_score110_81Pkinase_Tyr/PF07714_17/9e58Pkinase/PF00069_25/9_8e52Kinaselike/PF14531_6/2e09Pkinase_fungal/PF17667_1/2_1e06Kdo/PF06293_14/0_02Seadorna_VP7/PF07387_11/0_043SDA1/PF05285_12/7_1_NODE_1762_length_3826_cov_71_386273_g738_i16033368
MFVCRVEPTSSNGSSNWQGAEDAIGHLSSPTGSVDNIKGGPPHLTCTNLSCAGKLNLEEIQGLLLTSHAKRKMTPTPTSSRRPQTPRSTSEGSQYCSQGSHASSYEDSPPGTLVDHPKSSVGGPNGSSYMRYAGSAYTHRRDFSPLRDPRPTISRRPVLPPSVSSSRRVRGNASDSRTSPVQQTKPSTPMSTRKSIHPSRSVHGIANTKPEAYVADKFVNALDSRVGLVSGLRVTDDDRMCRSRLRGESGTSRGLGSRSEVFTKRDSWGFDAVSSSDSAKTSDEDLKEYRCSTNASRLPGSSSRSPPEVGGPLHGRAHPSRAFREPTSNKQYPSVGGEHWPQPGGSDSRVPSNQGRHRFTDWSSPMSSAPPSRRLADVSSRHLYDLPEPRHNALKRLLYNGNKASGTSLYGIGSTARRTPSSRHYENNHPKFGKLSPGGGYKNEIKKSSARLTLPAEQSEKPTWNVHDIRWYKHTVNDRPPNKAGVSTSPQNDSFETDFISRLIKPDYYSLDFLRSRSQGYDDDDDFTDDDDDEDNSIDNDLDDGDPEQEGDEADSRDGSLDGTRRSPESPRPSPIVRFEVSDGASPQKERPRLHQTPMMALSDICYRFTMEEIQAATNNFSNSSKLGEGANGKVYRGVLSSGTECAVKVMVCKDDHSGGFEEEIRFLSMFRHPNLVTLLGFAKDGTHRLLIYEYLAGGDLCTLLHRDQYVDGDGSIRSKSRHTRQKRSLLSWRSRVSAALDATQALSYLHSRTPKVFHRDVKAANILLDGRGVAKLADFGLAAYANRDKLTVAKAEGTPGYADPMYMQTLEVTEETEMYSLGMVLMELLTSQSPAVYTSGKRDLRFFIDSVNKADPMTIMDHVDYDCGWPEDIALEWAQLACRCIHDDVWRRPKCRDVVQMLRKIQSRASGRKSPSDGVR